MDIYEIIIIESIKWSLFLSLSVLPLTFSLRNRCPRVEGLTLQFDFQ